MNDFVKLQERNDWGKIAYTLEGKGMSNAGTFGIQGNPDVIVFTEGQHLSALSPDGTLVGGQVSFDRVWSPVGDHGHDYSFWGKVPRFVVDVRGIKAITSLHGLSVKLSDLVFQM